MRPLGIALFALLLFGTGCASNLVPFTQNMRDYYFAKEGSDENKLSEKSLKQVQFYLSSPIVLRRNLGNEDIKVTRRNRLRFKKGRESEQIIIEEGTPGVAEVIKEDSILISFEQGKSLEFGSMHTDENHQEVHGNKYQLYAQDWFSSTQGKVKYGGHYYYTAGSSSEACLLLDFKAMQGLTDTKKVRGRKVDKVKTSD